MSVRTLVVLALAIICGGSSAAGVYLMRGSNAPEKPETVSVVVAAKAIARGEVVTQLSLTTREWPAGFLPQNAVGDVEQIVDRTAMVPISPGEPILDTKVAAIGAGRGLAALVPEGRRAYTIQTTSVGSNVAGFVLPGNRVDVLLTLRGGPDDKTGGGSSTTLLQAVEILAVDQQLDAPSENRVEKTRSVTLLVTPDQAAMLDLGHNMGTLALSLRNPGDVAEAETSPATVNVLRFAQEPVDGAASGPPSMLATAAATAAKAAMMATMTTSAQKPTLPKPRYLQTYTLRGRSSGRIIVRPTTPH